MHNGNITYPGTTTDFQQFMKIQTKECESGGNIMMMDTPAHTQHIINIYHERISEVFHAGLGPQPMLHAPWYHFLSYSSTWIFSH